MSLWWLGLSKAETEQMWSEEAECEPDENWDEKHPTDRDPSQTRKDKRCPRCLGHGFVPIAPGAHLSTKPPDDGGDCSMCHGSGKIAA